jgi:Co/Zn/Cd efflux system component
VSDCCDCDVDARELHTRQRRVLLAVLAINVVTFSMMVVAAIFSRSSALLSGTLDNFGDAVTYGLSFAVVGAAAIAKARVALFKAAMILCAALAVAYQIGWRIWHPGVPIVETMGAAALLNLAANVVCLRLLTPHRAGDVNMASAWECSRNDVLEGVAVVFTSLAVWLVGSGWPDVAVAIVLLIVFLRSAMRVFVRAHRGLRPAAELEPS